MNEKRILKEIMQRLADRESWKVIVLKNNWLCPYCGEIGARALSMDEAIEHKIAWHFLRECPEWHNFKGDTIPLIRLKKKAQAITFKHKIKKHLIKKETWRFRDRAGNWICPFCAKATGIHFPPGEIDLDEEEEIINHMSAHILECPAYLEGSEEKSEAALRGRRQQINQKRKRKKLRESLATDLCWRFRDLDHHWLCPFCGGSTRIVFDKKEDVTDDFVTRVEAHLSHCKAYREFQGKPRTERFLKDRIIAINLNRAHEKVKRKILRHAVWQARDLDGVWYCPYCAEPTGVKLPNISEAVLTERVLGEIWNHMSSCTAYVRKKAQIRTKGYLNHIVESADRLIRLRRFVKKNIVKDPRWSSSDLFGSWICPYCKKVHKHINVSKEVSILDKTIEQVVDHLQENCPNYVEGHEPEATVEELQTIADDINRSKRKLAVTKIALEESGDDEWLRSINQEMQEIRSVVTVTQELEKSLEEARIKQRKLLPQIPEIPGFEFGCVYKPCSSVGGDFYDFIKVSEAELGIAIGDISGHGIEAALLMGLAKKLIEIHGRGRSSTAQTLLLANADIFPDLDAKTFVTVFYGILNTATKIFKFSRAGHNPLILFNERRRPNLQVLDSKGMALGMDMGVIFTNSIEELEIQLISGDMLLQYTDGVVESMNHEREEFGLERLYKTVEKFGGAEAEYLLYQIEKAIYDFSEGAKQKDDITMIAVKVV
jgi:serine phosphatase RsbU (regulator of sigma subunit)/rubredoxin